MIELSSPRNYQFEETWYKAASADHFWQKFRFEVLHQEIIKSGIPLTAPLKVLDIGAGRGVFRSQIESVTAWTIDCADLDRQALTASASSRGKNYYYDICDRHPQMVGQYDLIFLLDVIEHVQDTTPFLQAALQHLKKDGHLIINVPAHSWLFSRYDEAAGHFRRYSLSTLENEFLPLHSFTLQTLRRGYWGLSMIPLLILRMLSTTFFKKKESILQHGFQPPHPWLASLLLKIMRWDRFLIPHPPCGSSVFWIARCNLSQQEKQT